MPRATIEKRGNLWHVVVLYDDHKVAVVGRYPARYKAQEHADQVNGEHPSPIPHTSPDTSFKVDPSVADGTPASPEPESETPAASDSEQNGGEG